MPDTCTMYTVWALQAAGASGVQRGTVCYRGLRVRMGLHSGLEDEHHILFNKPSGAFKYYGGWAVLPYT